MNPALDKHNKMLRLSKGGVNSRLRKIFPQLKQENVDGLLLNSPANISYLTKYRSRDAYLVVSRQGNIYVTDSRYTEEAKINLKNLATIKKINASVFKTIALACQELGLKRVGFEERYLAFAEYQKIKTYLHKDISLVPTHSLVEGLRQLKDEDEIKKIRQAIKITLAAFDYIRDFLKAGVKELEVAGELERFIRHKGASTSAFEIIVASGPNAAYPHHITSQRKLCSQESVLIDMGVDFSGYKSDLTRTFFLDKITPLARKVYNTVREAQSAAFRYIKPGVVSIKIDQAARRRITQKGYGAFFGHNLGHGVGLEVHEAPSISGKEKITLEPGMVFTVEPVIYLPRRLGVRIEDMVLVTQKGMEILSGSLNK
jgi:Xaa-Pro aminopeptidase